MIVLFVFAWIITGIITHLTIGTVLSRKAVPAFWRKAEMKYGGGTSSGYYPDERPARIRRSVREQSEVMVIFWPVALTVLLISRALDSSIEQHDPAEIARRDEEQKARIAELEKELGINQPKDATTLDLLTRKEFSKLSAAERRAYLEGRRGFTDQFLEDVEDHPQNALARTINEMRAGRRRQPRNYDRDDVTADDTYTTVRPRRVRSADDVNESYRASTRWTGEI